MITLGLRFSLNLHKCEQEPVPLRALLGVICNVGEEDARVADGGGEALVRGCGDVEVKILDKGEAVRKGRVRRALGQGVAGRDEGEGWAVVR